MRRDRVAVVMDGLPARRWPRRLVIGLLAFVLLFHLAGGWYFSGLIRSDALLVEESAPEYVHEVTGISAESISFAVPSNPEADLLSPEVLGVRWEDGYGLSGEIVSRSDGSIAKQFNVLAGDPPAIGTMVALEGEAAPPDPADAGIEHRTVTYTSDFGEFEAWQVGEGGGTWAIFVHGRGATPREGLRVLPTLVGLGIPTLLIEYRNDPGAPAAGDHLATFGVEEWQDLEGAVRFALRAGADEIVLIGNSMGAAISLSFLDNSEQAGIVSGLILDSPALELGAMVDARAADTNLPLLPIRVPVTLTAVSKWMASMRFGADWGGMDYLDDRADDLDIPVLIFHGVADETVPIDLSRELADRLPDLVTLEEFVGADHVRSWNVDPERYEAAVAAFLAELEK